MYNLFVKRQFSVAENSVSLCGIIVTSISKTCQVNMNRVTMSQTKATSLGPREKICSFFSSKV